jgi:hypothetical protein
MLLKSMPALEAFAEVEEPSADAERCRDERRVRVRAKEEDCRGDQKRDGGDKPQLFKDGRPARIILTFGAASVFARVRLIIFDSRLVVSRFSIQVGSPRGFVS